MAKNNRFTVQYRRKREGKTNYKKRLKILKANKPRLAIRKSLKNITIQIIEYHPEGDKIITSVVSKELEKLGWSFNKSNIPSAYLTGLLLGKKAIGNKINEVVVDFGLNESVKGSKLYAVLKGISDSGLAVPVSEKILPHEDRIVGKHISDYDELLKKDDEKRKRQFSGYMKNNVNIKDIKKLFDEIKGKILKS